MSTPAFIEAVVVDDVDACRELLDKQLKDLYPNIRVHHVQDGIQALKVIKREVNGNIEEHQFLVFLDIDMPGIDGLETLARLRETFPELYVVMLSGHTTVENIRAALQTGANGFISKPFESEKIKETLLQYLKAKHA